MNEIKGNFMNNAKEEVKNLIKNRISSPFYGTFIFSWMAWNWKFIYITLFLDSDLLFKKYFLLKTDYINIWYIETSYFEEYGYFVWFIIFPLISTLFIIFIFSKLITLVYKKDKDTLKERKIIDIKAEKEVEEKNIELYKTKNLSKKEEKIYLNNEQEAWLEEFKKWKNDQRVMAYIEDIYISTSDYRGEYQGRYSDNILYGIKNKESMVWSKLNNLIMDNAGSISLTDKGNYILKLYLDEKNKD